MSMAASNFERLYFEGVRHEGVDTARAMRAFADAGMLDVPPSAMSMIRELFRGAMIDEAETARTMVATHHLTGELIDPHTAVGVAAARRIGAANPTTPLVVMATAHPAKFPETVKAATGEDVAVPPQARALQGRPERFERLPADLGAVKEVVRDVMGLQTA